MSIYEELYMVICFICVCLCRACKYKLVIEIIIDSGDSRERDYNKSYNLIN